MGMGVCRAGVVVSLLTKTVLLVTSVPKRDVYLLGSIAILRRSARGVTRGTGVQRASAPACLTWTATRIINAWRRCA